MRLFNPQRGIINHLLVLTFAFGFGMAIFALLAVVSYRSGQQAKNTLEQAKAAAKEAGRKEQKAEDIKLAEQPYRSYIAPRTMGGFEIKFPKSWSSLLEEDAAEKQLELIVHPDFVRTGDEEETKHALVVKLVEERTAALLRDYNELVADKQVSARAVKVSGLAATWFEGSYTDDHNGAIVLIPYRDKTITIETQDKQFLPQLAQVLAESKITP